MNRGKSNAAGSGLAIMLVVGAAIYALATRGLPPSSDAEGPPMPSIPASQPLPPMAAADRAIPVQGLSPEQYKQLVLQTDFAKRTVDVEEFLKLRAQPGTVVLDLRSREEFEASHIEGALHLGPDVNDRKLAELVPDKETPILLYCTNSIAPYPTRMMSLTMTDLPQVMALGYRNVWRLKDFALIDDGAQKNPLPMTGPRK